VAKMLTPAQFAEKQGVSRQYVQRMLTAGRIAGAKKAKVVVEKWQIPEISELPKSNSDKELQPATGKPQKKKN
jgi:hypothetical protein